MLARSQQLSNAHNPISVIVLGSLTVFNAKHPEKQYAGIELTPSGISITGVSSILNTSFPLIRKSFAAISVTNRLPLSDIKIRKLILPICSTEKPKFIVLRLEQYLNAFTPISTIEFGVIISLSFKQPSKQLAPILVTLSGMLILTNSWQE